MIPTVGRIVHYVGHDGVHYAALITRVPPHPGAAVSLVVFQPGILIEPSVPYDAEGAKDTWHWPEREGDSRFFTSDGPPPPVEETA